MEGCVGKKNKWLSLKLNQLALLIMLIEVNVLVDYMNSDVYIFCHEQLAQNESGTRET